jgi:hypothetical protein
VPILVHRAFRTLTITPANLVRSAALAAVVTVAWLSLRPAVARFWAAIIEVWCRWLGVPAAVSVVETQGTLFRNGTLQVDVVGYAPNTLALAVVAGLTVVVAAGTLLLPGRLIPLSYMLRAFCVIQASSVIYFAFFPTQFPHTLSSYISTMLASSMAFISTVPSILAFTFFIFDFTLLRKLALTALLMMHLTVLVPFLYLLHLYFISKWTLVFMPAFYILFGLLLQVGVFIAFYSWGMSWASRDEEQLW